MINFEGERKEPTLGFSHHNLQSPLFIAKSRSLKEDAK